MKGLCHICLILFVCIQTSCKEKVQAVIDEIPVEDRFVYSKGDTLTYKCSDGTTNAVLVKDYQFWTQTPIGIETWYGGSGPWIRDRQRITIESLSDRWQKVLSVIWGNSLEISSCFIIDTSLRPYDENGNPFCSLINRCDYADWFSAMDGSQCCAEQSFNGHLYKKLYYFNSFLGVESNSYTVYFNLKYGIIRFESVIDGKQEIWDLVNPKL